MAPSHSDKHHEANFVERGSDGVFRPTIDAEGPLRGGFKNWPADEQRRLVEFFKILMDWDKRAQQRTSSSPELGREASTATADDDPPSNRRAPTIPADPCADMDETRRHR